MSAQKTCACGRRATHARWPSSVDTEARRGVTVAYAGGPRVPACAFHSVHPDAPHPFDIHKVLSWPHALETST